MNFETKTIPIRQLHPNTGQIPDVPKNPRRIEPERLEALKRSISDAPEMLKLRELLVYELVSEGKHSYIVIAGNMRLKAMKAIGIKEAPCKVLASDTPSAKLREYTMKDNIAFGETDMDAVLSDWNLDELQDWGFVMEADGTEEAPKEEVAKDDNFDPELEPVQTMCKRGEVWQLGHHILMCGDSTSPEDVQKLMGGGIADLLVTDPPYGLDYKSTDDKKIDNDNLAGSQFDEFLTKAFTNAMTNLKAGAAFYIWHADYRRANFLNAMKASGMELREVLVWVKNSFTLSRQDYQWRHESCIYGWKEGAAHYFVNERTNSTVIEDAQELDFSKMKADEMRSLLKRIYSDDTPSTILRFNKPTRSAEHPTMKPVLLIADNIRCSSTKGQTVLDLFGGSGTTLIACEQMGRVCHMMEYDPHYCDVIISRWERLTGKEAKLIE